jgi:hypothetical protein
MARFPARGFSMMQPVRSYIRAQGVNCAVVNAVFNPVLSLLVSLFVTPAAHRDWALLPSLRSA